MCYILHMVDRMDKINELIKQEVSVLILQIVPDEIISVTEVKVSKDLSYAKIWISSLKNTEDAVKKCQSEASGMQKELAGKIIMRRVPKLHFVADFSSMKAAHIENIIKDINKK